MRKKVFGRKLGRNRKSRSILFRSLSKAMILRGSIKTTAPKAKALAPRLDSLMALVAEGSLSARRRALSLLANDKAITDMLFEKYAKLSVSRKSGFTTSSALAPRRGDAAQMVQLSWVETTEGAKNTKDAEGNVK